MIRLQMSDKACRVWAKPIAVFLLSCVLMTVPGVGMAQGAADESPSSGPPTDEPVTDEASGGEGQPETPETPPEQRKNPFKRIGPQPLTAEQREEAERLRKVAAKYGTDPTAIVGRMQLTSQYLDLTPHANATLTTARVDLPFRGDYLLRVEMPFLRTTDAQNPGMGSQRGLSDLSVVAGWRAYNTPEYALLVGAVGSFPTASEPALGFGKYTVGPAVATARFLPRLDSFLIGLLSYQTSVGGDPSRKDVSLFNITAQVNSFWGQRWWTIVQSVWNVDFERSGKSSMVMEFEAGRNLIGRFGAYVRPGVGIYGRDLIGAYVWNVEVGVRYMFTSF
ncbi:MAG TPA: hypothetical protein VJR69_11350 [Nitrospira sp.]|nr:hypothetical protein [Nitrospira sp.]